MYVVSVDCSVYTAVNNDLVQSVNTVDCVTAK